MSDRPTIRMAVRDWEFLTPLLLGDVRSERINLVVERVAEPNLPHIGESQDFDVGEASFSRYAQARAAGDTSAVGISNFILRGFRHRCVITRSGSPLQSLGELKGKRIGLTGWQDSGNTWTRAAVREEGVGIEDAVWFVGRLTAQNPIVDRLGRFVRPGRIEATPEHRPLMDLLDEGWLDAVFTPFMPQGIFEASPRFRPVDLNFRASEKRYFDRVGYVPGIHLLTVKASLTQRFPWLAEEISALTDASRKRWQQKRERHADATPWLFDELLKSSQDLPPTWDQSGLTANAAMIEGFIGELHAQGIVDRRMERAELFPEASRG